MALYHFHVTQVKRSAGQSVVNSAAYRAGEKLYSDYYGEVSDYTHKGGVICSEILLPPRAPPEYADRQTLWNAVEKAEHGKDAQLAYSLDIALQNELTMEENIALARRFLLEQFISKGMIVDFAVHAPDREPDGIPNPHFHVLCPIRPLKADGTWGAKQRRVYRLDDYGERICGKNGKPLFDAAPTTDWGKPETLQRWREEWANYVNRSFERAGFSCRVDHRTLEKQGVDRLPTIHEGPTVRAMEAKGIATDKGEFNRWTRVTDAALRKLREKIKELLAWLKEIRKELSAPREPTLAEYLRAYYDRRNAGAWSNKAKVNNLKAHADTFNFLTERRLYTFDDLLAYTDALDKKLSKWNAAREAKKARIRELDGLISAAENYMEYKPVVEKLNSIKFTKRREAFKAQHDREITMYYAARRKLNGFISKGAPPVEHWKQERAKLRWEHGSVEAEYTDLYHESMELLKIRKCVEDVRHQRERTRQAKRRDMER